jgi:hypothetical protein
LIPKISPIVAFVQENISKGKTASAIKEMVKSKFVMADIKYASEALGIVLSKEGLAENHINDLMNEGKISCVLGEELKKIGKKFPSKEAPKFASVSSDPQIGVQGYFHVLTGKKIADENDAYCKIAVEAM